MSSAASRSTEQAAEHARVFLGAVVLLVIAVVEWARGGLVAGAQRVDVRLPRDIALLHIASHHLEQLAIGRRTLRHCHVLAHGTPRYQHIALDRVGELELVDLVRALAAECRVEGRDALALRRPELVDDTRLLRSRRSLASREQNGGHDRAGGE